MYSYIPCLLRSVNPAIYFILLAIFLPIMIIFFAIAAVSMFWMAKGYIKAVTDLRRLTLVTTSPVLSASTEAVNGFATIRSYNRISALFNTYAKNCDSHVSCLLHETYAQRWVEFYMDIFVSIIVTCVMILVKVSTYIELNSTVDDS